MNAPTNGALEEAPPLPAAEPAMVFASALARLGEVIARLGFVIAERERIEALIHEERELRARKDEIERELFEWSKARGGATS